MILNNSTISAQSINSTNYQTSLSLSNGEINLISENYNTDTTLGTITTFTNSTQYQQSIGFLYTLATFCGDNICDSDESCSSCLLDCGACPTTPTSGGGGGGGGTTIKKISNLTLNKNLIKILIKQGETQKEIIEIINTGNTILNLSLEVESVEEFMAISEKSFSLNPGESKNINIDIFAKEEEIPEAYTGRLIFRDKETNTIKIINIIIEIKERKPLFDILVEILTKEIAPGKKIKAQISTINKGDLKHIDVLIYYAIKDMQGKIITFREESIAIEDKLNIMRELQTPKNTQLGEYTFYSKVYYNNITATSVDNFSVVEKNDFTFYITIGFIILSIIILSIIIFILIKRYLKENATNNSAIVSAYQN